MLSALTIPLLDSSAERNQHDIVLHMSMYLVTDQWNNTVSHSYLGGMWQWTAVTQQNSMKLEYNQI